MKAFYLVIASLSLLIFSSCASVKTQGVSEQNAQLRPQIVYPPYTGPKFKVQVLSYGIPQKITQQYPDLADKKIGWGLYNRLLDELYETGRFEFLEDKSDVQSRILQNWALSESGAGVEQSQSDFQGIKTPDYFIYAEVFEFSVSRDESVQVIQSNQMNTTWIGVQIRMVNAKDGSFVPASGKGMSEQIGESVLMSANMSFDQSTIGMATEQASSEAVFQLLKRWNP